MLNSLDLRKIAKARLKDAEILYDSQQYDGATYLCGYAVEMALKASICKVLHWDEYTLGKGYGTFKTHDLDILLHLSGKETRIKKEYFSAWSHVTTWEPEMRYKPVGSATKEDTEFMIESSKRLLSVL